MSLPDWLRNSWLVAHKTSAEEIAGLLAIVERDLSNAKLPGLADDWKFSIGYNAALQASDCGTLCRRIPRRQGTAPLSNDPEPVPDDRLAAKMDRFDRMRKKRNIAGYEAAGVVSEREAREMYELAAGLRDDVLAWLKKEHASLLKK